MRQLTSDGNISVAPTISADARKIAYTGYLSGYADIYLIELSNGARNRIVKFPGTNSGAAFSPDGGRIACTLSKDGNPELYVVGANGGGAHRLTRTPGVESSPTWSPDGNEIAYSSDERGRAAALPHRLRRRQRTAHSHRLRVLHRAELVAGWPQARLHDPAGRFLESR